MIIPHPHPLRTTASHIHSSFLSLRQKYSRPDVHVVVGIMGLLSCEMGLAGKEFWPFGAYVIVRSCILKIIA